MKEQGRRYWHFLLLCVIVCSMMSQNALHSQAKAKFASLRPEGVMATAVKNKVVISWEPVQGASGYSVYEAVESGEEEPVFQKAGQTKKCKLVLSGRIRGERYRYYVCAWKQKKNGKIKTGKKSTEAVTVVAEEGISTISNLLRIAVAPVGSTMYVWGGGWNKADTAAGKEARSIGLCPGWRTFAARQNTSYNYRNHRYQIHDGLDCSGYVGWCVYNLLNTGNQKKGYVYSASKQAEKFSGMGYGSYRTAEQVADYEPGDIMSSTCSCCGHVWIVVGACEDGSVVLVHSSPAGVRLCGTVTPDGRKDSEACTLAEEYMRRYYPDWYRRFPDVCKGSSYLQHYGQMRWKSSGKGIALSDPEGYRGMYADEILRELYREE